MALPYFFEGAWLPAAPNEPLFVIPSSARESRDRARARDLQFWQEQIPRLRSLTLFGRAPLGMTIL